ncbi:MAG: hypothetical protein Q9209_001192 [Squamulea sp. 1 TL-2023]
MPPAKVASQDFVKPNLPRHSNNGFKRSRASSVHSPNVRLSIIDEDAASAPPMPAKAHHRPFHRRWNLGDPPRSSFESPPPKYSVWDTMGPKGEKLADVRNNKHIARRGGWRRIFLILLILLTIIVGLTVGLAIGLRNKENTTPISSHQPSSPSTTPSPAPFPAGSYTLTTYLSTVQTNCASRPQDWSCYPYHTYSQSPTEALANFTWIITSSSPSHNEFTISSTSNPWSVNFASTPLTKLDAGTGDERWRFETTFDKTTFPSIGVNCYFNETTLEGNLYTKKARDYPSPTPSEPSVAESRDEFQPWPYAIDIRQIVGGGQNTLQCFRMQSGGVGDRVTDGVVPKGENEICSCEYRNFG